MSTKKKSGQNYTKAEKEQKKREMLDALAKTMGVITPACEMVGISRKTEIRWRKEDPEYAAAVADVSEVALDFVETKLFKKINDGSEAAIIFYLKTKGRNRGYFERKEIAGEINVNPPAIIIEGEEDDG